MSNTSKTDTKPAKLNKKQLRFCEEYVVDLNATQAALRAGYSKRTAASIGAENLRKPHIKQKVAELSAVITEKAGFDADYVQRYVAEMLEADIADIVDDNGAYLPVKQWPLVWRRMLSGLDIQEVFTGSGIDRHKIGETLKIKFIDRLRALEILGKHKEVQAFKEVLVIEGDVDAVSILNEATARADKATLAAKKKVIH